MLRLLFCTAAILPIAVIPWMTSEADTAVPAVQEASYAELVTDPSIDALSDCETGELPIFFRDDLVTTHSAEFIVEGLEAAEGCGSVDVTIVPLLPEEAAASDHAESEARAEELALYVEAAADQGNVDVDLGVAQEPVEEEISTLYMNGRAAILRIDPQDAPG
ncbi:MAG: hypothetical protein WBG08_06945 [Litorimonas sp.]